VRGLRVPLEHRTGTGRVDQLDPAGEDRGGQVHGHARDPAAVGRVTAFRYQVGQRGQRMLLLVSVQEPDLGPLVLAVPHGGGHGGQRGHPRRQHVAIQQRVDQRALAPLSLADD